MQRSYGYFGTGWLLMAALTACGGTGGSAATDSTMEAEAVWKKQSDGKWKAIIDIDNADQ